MGKIIKLITLIFMLALSSTSNAGLYSKCIYGYNFEGGDVETFLIYPINEACYNYCDEGCRSLFSVETEKGTEMNDDVITRCKSYCQSSINFSSYYRDESGELKGPLTGPSPHGSCETTQVWNRVYKASKLLKSGDNILVESVDDQEGPVDGNKVYGCGKESVEIKSIFKSDKTADWPSISGSFVSNDGVYNGWKESTDHYCLNSATNRPIESIMKSKLLTGLDYVSINSNLLPSQPIPYIDSPSSTPCSGSSCPLLPDYRKDSDMLDWYKMNSGPCRFHARAESPVSTGLYVQNGDELSITWSGNYSAYPSTYSSTIRNVYGRNKNSLDAIVGLSLNEAIICARNANIVGNYKVKIDGYSSEIAAASDDCQTLAYEKSKLAIQIGGNSLVLSGEEARADPIFTNPITGKQRILNNLTGIVADDPLVVLNEGSPKDCKAYFEEGSCPDRSVNCSTCFYIYGTNSSIDGSTAKVAGKIKDSRYTYSGVLSANPETNFTTVERRSPISFPNRDSLTLFSQDYGARSDNVGGLDVSIKWGGCPKPADSKDDRDVPDAIEYVINSCDLDPEQMYDNAGYNKYTASWVSYSWLPLPLDKAIGVDTVACPSAPCCVYFRVKDQYIAQNVNGDVSLTGSAIVTSNRPLWGTGNVGLKNLYGNPGNRHGYYRLALKNPQPSFDLPKAETKGVMHNIVSFVLKKIIGTPPNYSTGALMGFYKEVIKGKGYVDFIRVLLGLYVAFFGLGFMMGAVEINLKELLSRLIKVSFVIAMLSDTSWKFFSEYILPATINGPAELSAAFVLKVSGATGMSSNFPDTDELGVPIETAISQDPSLIIALMVDQPLRYIWKSLGIIFPKLVAVLFSSPFLGFFIALALFLSLIVYSIGLLKIVMIYMLSFVAIGCLIFMAPLAIPMVLFKFTQDVFDRWWKYLLSFAIQPVLLFAGVSVLNFLTIAVFVASFSYTVCQSCLLNFPLLNICIIPAYKLMETLHMPASVGSSMPAAMIVSSSLFTLLSYAMYEMPSVFTSIASRLITGVSGANIGSAADEGYGSVGLNKANDLKNAPGKLLNAGKDMLSIGSDVVGSVKRLRGAGGEATERSRGGGSGGGGGGGNGGGGGGAGTDGNGGGGNGGGGDPTGGSGTNVSDPTAPTAGSTEDATTQSTENKEPTKLLTIMEETDEDLMEEEDDDKAVARTELESIPEGNENEEEKD